MSSSLLFLMGSGAGAGSPAQLILDPPVSSTVSSITYYAFGFDRLVSGYSGNTVRLKRLSDNAQADFGCTSIGLFDYTAVTTWASGANVDVVKFYDQKGSATELIATGTVSFIRSSVVKRFGTTLDSDTLLVRDPDNGGVGAYLGSANDGAFYTGALTIPQSTTGLEIHYLFSPEERKMDGTYKASDPWGANNDSEYFMCYGTTSNTISHQTGGDWRDIIAVSAGSTDFVLNGDKMSYRQYSQQVITYALGSSSFSVYDRGKKTTTNYAGTNITSIPAGGLNNGGLFIGGNKGANLTSVAATARHNGIFGGVILTQALSDAQRYELRAKLAAVGQQHYIRSRADIEAYFTEMFIGKDASSGTWAGRLGACTLELNTSVVAEGTPNWQYNYELPGIGIKGLRAPPINAGSPAGAGNLANAANSMKATSTYFAGKTKGSVWAVVHSEYSGNNLASYIGQATGNGRDSVNLSLKLGFDHNTVAAQIQWAASRDPNGLTGVRKRADRTQFGAAIYDGQNQALGKYNRNVANIALIFGETISGYTWTESTWAGTDGSAPYLLDAPVINNVKDKITYELKDSHWYSHFTTWEAPAGYSRSDTLTNRENLRLQSDNWSYIATDVNPVGHRDGQIANNPYGVVCDSDDNAYLMTINSDSQPVWCGPRFLMAFAEEPLTYEQVMICKTNEYKFIGESAV